MEESKVKTAEIIAEELWDKYSEYIDDDIMSLDSVAGSSVIKSRRLFLKAVVEASSILEARNKELEEALESTRNLIESDAPGFAIQRIDEALNKK